MDHLADSVFELSDEEILAEVRESGADPEQEAERTRLVLRRASKAFDDVNNRVSKLGHSINSHDWRGGQGSYHNNCLNCGASVSFSTTTQRMEGNALDGSCPDNGYTTKKREASR
jgi:hypothetical protein